MSKNILITGGCGFIGSNLTDELIKNPENKVTVLDDLSTGTLDNIKHHIPNQRFAFIKDDIRDYSSIKPLFQDIDTVYHLAVQCVRVSLFNPDLVHEVNATGTLNVLKASLENKIKKFVYVSSSEVYGSAISVPMAESHPTNPTTVYGASKLAGEKYTEAFFSSYGLNTAIVRPFNTYGPREHFEGPYGEVIPKFSVRIKNKKAPLIFGDGNQTRDFTYVSDTVNGLISVANSEKTVGQIVNIARGEEVSINRISQLVANGLNSGLLPEYRSHRPGDVMRHYADIAQARKIVGFEPKVNIEDGIKMYLSWLNEQKIDFSKETELNWIKND